MDNEQNQNVNTETQGQQEQPIFNESQMEALQKMFADMQSNYEKKLQSETDKVRTKYTKQLQEVKKQQSLSGLDESERTKQELEMLKKEIEERDKQDLIRATRNEIEKTLRSRNLDGQFADLLNITDDIEEAQAVIDKFDKLFKESVKKEVERRLQTTTPKQPTRESNNSGAPSFSEFSKMRLSERKAFEKQYPDLYREYMDKRNI